jgi:hypothetical protein
MNAGIADAMHLPWKLAGVLNRLGPCNSGRRSSVSQSPNRYHAPRPSHASRWAVRSPTTWRSSVRRATRFVLASGKAPTTERRADLLWRAQLRLFLQEFSDYRVRRPGSPGQATRSTTSSSPRFRAAARRMYGCAVEDHCMTLWDLCEPILR